MASRVFSATPPSVPLLGLGLRRHRPVRIHRGETLLVAVITLVAATSVLGILLHLRGHGSLAMACWVFAFLVWCSLWLAECLRVAKPGAPIAVFSDWRQLATMIDAIQCGGFVFRGVMPWDKTEAVRPRMGGFRSQCEYVVWG